MNENKIYFIQQAVTNCIKIGISINPQNRLNSLSTGSPYPLSMLLSFPGNEEQERLLHHRFSSLRLSGEWFSAGDDLIKYIEEHHSFDGNWNSQGKCFTVKQAAIYLDVTCRTIRRQLHAGSYPNHYRRGKQNQIFIPEKDLVSFKNSVSINVSPIKIAPKMIEKKTSVWFWGALKITHYYEEKEGEIDG